MTDYIRTQILLEKEQRKQLREIAERDGVSFSELVRDLLDLQLRSRAYEEMRHAAEQLCGDYSKDKQLTDMSALDGEDFLNV
jgi:predicted DNA-binding ribbon-helix-helix protein